MTPDIIAAILASIGMWGFFVAGYMLAKTDAERNRLWVGLTDEEITTCIQMGESGYLDGFVKPLATFRAIEAKLREKNT